MDPCVGMAWEYSWISYSWLEWLFDGYCERLYIAELRLSPGIHAYFELRMDASKVRSIRDSGH